MKSIYREVIITAVAYTVSILCISAVNQKYKKRISSIKYILSVIVVPVSVLGERVITNFLEMVCASITSSKIDTLNMGIINTAFEVTSIVINFLTIIIIFKLITECKITKGIWLIFVVCMVIGIVASIIGAIYSANMLSKINAGDMLSGANIWLYPSYDDITKLNIISIVLIVNRCMLVVLSTWSAVKQLLKRDEMNMTVES